MKILAAVLMFVVCGVAVNAQDAKVLAEIAASSEGTVKNAPFSADAVSESVQTLADGNRIVRNTTTKLHRNSEGRFRREVKSGSGGVLGSVYTFGQGVTLLDPVGGFRYMIDPNLRTTRQMVFRPSTEIRIVNGVGTTSEGGVVGDRARAEINAVLAAKGSGQNTVIVSEKIRDEYKAAIAAAPAAAATAVRGVVAAHPAEGLAMTYSTGGQSNWDKRTDDLGTQNIEGVEAEGTRTVTTIPAGAIGNERPIEITYEKWYSKDLQLVVMSKHNDPRFGEQTYRLTNIVRSEPDPSLFTLPNGYKLITEPSGTYTITTAGAREPVAPRPASRATSAPAVKAKP